MGILDHLLILVLLKRDGCKKGSLWSDNKSFSWFYAILWISPFVTWRGQAAESRKFGVLGVEVSRRFQPSKLAEEYDNRNSLPVFFKEGLRHFSFPKAQVRLWTTFYHCGPKEAMIRKISPPGPRQHFSWKCTWLLQIFKKTQAPENKCHLKNY